jgi:hypothetical protein
VLLRDLDPLTRARCLKTEDFVVADVTASGLMVRETAGEGPPDAGEVARAQAWLALHTRPARRVRRERNSYDLKTLVGVYVGNGAVIAAALGLGYRVWRTSPTSVNAHINLILEGK